MGVPDDLGLVCSVCQGPSAAAVAQAPEPLVGRSSAYGVTYFTAYRMLIDQCQLQAGHNVLIWGAAGGLGVFAAQLCRSAGANAVGIVSSEEKGELAKELGTVDYINRNEFAGMIRRGGENQVQEKERFKVMRLFANRVQEILGDSPDIVFEHVGKEVFPTSVFTVKPFGKVVTCGATTGYMLDFDVRYLWMRQKQIIGSHAFNAYEAWLANELIARGQIRPVLWRAMGFNELPEAHRLRHENRHLGERSRSWWVLLMWTRARPTRARARSESGPLDSPVCRRALSRVRCASLESE